MRKIINKARETPKQFSALLYHIINLGKQELGQAKRGMYNSRDRWGLDPSGIAINLTNLKDAITVQSLQEKGNKKFCREEKQGTPQKGGVSRGPPPAKPARLRKLDRLNS